MQYKMLFSFVSVLGVLASFSSQAKGEHDIYLERQEQFAPCSAAMRRALPYRKGSSLRVRRTFIVYKESDVRTIFEAAADIIANTHVAMKRCGIELSASDRPSSASRRSLLQVFNPFEFSSSGLQILFKNGLPEKVLTPFGSLPFLFGNFISASREQTVRLATHLYATYSSGTEIPRKLLDAALYYRPESVFQFEPGRPALQRMFDQLAQAESAGSTMGWRGVTPHPYAWPGEADGSGMIGNYLDVTHSMSGIDGNPVKRTFREAYSAQLQYESIRELEREMEKMEASDDQFYTNPIRFEASAAYQRMNALYKKLGPDRLPGR